MFRTLMLILAATAFAATAAPVATVVSTAVDPQTHEVKVTYSLSEAAIVTIGAEVSSDGTTWSTIDEKVHHVVGDANRLIAAGSGYVAIWNANRDWPGHPTNAEQIRIVVRCWSESNPPLYFVMSLDDTSKRAYYTDVSQIPGGIAADAYKSEYLVMRRIYAKGIVWPMGSPSTETGRGSNEAQHYIRLDADYYMAVYEMTIAQNMHINGGNSNSSRSDPMLPVDAIGYVTLRGSGVGGGDDPTADSVIGKLRTTTGLAFDLPTDAQWEYACRAGTGGGTYTNAPIAAIAWMADNNIDDGVNNRRGSPREVGTKPPNPWGLYDMYGNISEWCRDFYGSVGGSTDIANPDEDAAGPASNGNDRFVKRGGAYCSPAKKCRSAARGYLERNYSLETSNGNGWETVYSNGYRLALPIN